MNGCLLPAATTKSAKLHARRQVQVAIVGECVEISTGGEVPRSTRSATTAHANTAPSPTPAAAPHESTPPDPPNPCNTATGARTEHGYRDLTIQTDNGSEFGSQFHWHVLDRGIRHVYIKPATPRLNGKVERSHRTDAEEFYALLDGVIIDDANVFNERLAEWENYYNQHRPHGALNGQTPLRTPAPTYDQKHNRRGPVCNGSPSVAHCGAGGVVSHHIEDTCRAS